MNIKTFFNTHVVFRLKELVEFAQEQSGASATADKNIRMELYRYCKKDKLTNVRRGLYVVNAEQQYQSNAINPLLIAGKATDDAVIAYHSALESHNLAYTDFNEHTYLTKYHTNNFDFQNQHYRAIYQESSDLLAEKKQWVEPIKMLGVIIHRTTLERTIVDVLDRPDISGGWEEVIRSLERVTAFNIQEAINYALSLNRASIVAKLGYFLEQRPSYLKVDEKILNQLLPYVPKQPYYLDRKAIGRGTYLKKWQIIVPDYLHKRQWEEPDELDY